MDEALKHAGQMIADGADILDIGGESTRPGYRPVSGQDVYKRQIMEEAHEFIDRVQNNGVLPMMTSCSPGWIKYCEHYYPDQLEHLSSCKSPQQLSLIHI